jgi:hypothetical protein
MPGRKTRFVFGLYEAWAQLRLPKMAGQMFMGGAPACGRIPGFSSSSPVSGLTSDQMLMFLANFLACTNLPLLRSSAK